MATSSMTACAFLFIDLQPLFARKFDDSQFALNIAELLSFARSVVPASNIVHLRANYADTPMKPYSKILNPNLPMPGDSDLDAVSWAKELPGEVVIVKSTVDGFHETILNTHLKEKGIERIICCGLLTCCCVHETAIGGMNRGFLPLLVEDCCADKNQEKHDATIMLYKDYMYQTMTLNQLKQSCPL